MGRVEEVGEMKELITLKLEVLISARRRLDHSTAFESKSLKQREPWKLDGRRRKGCKNQSKLDIGHVRYAGNGALSYMTFGERMGPCPNEQEEHLSTPSKMLKKLANKVEERDEE